MEETDAPIWEFQNDKLIVQFDDITTAILENCHDNKTEMLQIQWASFDYDVNLKDMTMVNQKDPNDKKTIIRRIAEAPKQFEKFEIKEPKEKTPMEHVDPYSIQKFYNLIPNHRKKQFVQNMMNYGLEMAEGDTNHPLLMCVKDLDYIAYEISLEKAEIEKDELEIRLAKEKLERQERQRIFREEKAKKKLLEEQNGTLIKEEKKDDVEEDDEEEDIPKKRDSPTLSDSPNRSPTKDLSPPLSPTKNTSPTKDIKEPVKKEVEFKHLDKIEIKNEEVKKSKSLLNMFSLKKSEKNPYVRKSPNVKNFESEVIDSVKSFLSRSESIPGYFYMFLPDIEMNLPEISTYLVDSCHLKLIDVNSKSLHFHIGQQKLSFFLNFSISKNFDVNFEISTKEKKLFNWNASINKWISSYKHYVSVESLLSHCMYLFVDMIPQTTDNVVEYKPDVSNLVSCYTKVWGDSKNHSDLEIVKSSEFIMKQIEAVKNLSPHSFDYTNPFKWNLSLTIEKNSQLFEDLSLHSKKFFIKDTNLHFEVYFDRNFPNSRPIVRIVKPRLIYSSTNMRSDGTIVLDDWNPKISIGALISHLLDELTTSRVDMRINTSYDVFHHIKVLDIPTKDEFEEEFYAFSGDFATKCFYGHHSHRLERANNVCFPKSLLKRFPQYMAKKSDPLTFEITHNGQLNGYCGLLEPSAPNKCVIFPNWMMQDMMLHEGSKIKLRCVDLALSELVTFRPLSKKFYKVQNVDVALTEALRPYTSLFKGQVIPLSDGHTTIHLEVASCKPSDAVRIQVARNQFLDLKLEFAPAIDFCQETFNESTLSSLKKTSPTKISNFGPEVKDEVKSAPVSDIQGIPCLNCKKIVPEKTMDLHLTHCKRNYYTCDKCEQVVRVSDKKQHEDSEHVITSCSICKESMEMWKFKVHALDCKLKPCQFCSIDYKPLEIKDHEGKCQMIQEQCHDCGQLFLRKNLIKHAKICNKEHVMFKGREFNPFNTWRAPPTDQDFKEEDDQLQKIISESQINDDVIPHEPVGGFLTCSYCQLGGQTKELLLNHLLDVHPDDPEHLIETLAFL